MIIIIIIIMIIILIINTKPVTIRAAMLGESKGNSELCSHEPL